MADITLTDPALEAATIAAAAADPQAAVLLADLPEGVFAQDGYGALLAAVCGARVAGAPLPPLPEAVAGAAPVPDPVAAAQRLRDLAAWRVTAAGLAAISTRVLSGAGAAADALDAIEAVVATARDQLAAVRAGEVAPLADGVGGLLGTLRERREARETTGRPVVGLSTGLGPRLDTALNGLCGGRTYVLGGEPGVGKTTVAWWVAQHAARQGACAVYLDAENGADALLLRALAAQAGVPFGDYERGYGDLDALEAAAAAMGDVLRRVYVLDARIAGITPQQLAARAAKARALCHADGLLVVVDYLQKLATDGPDRRIQVEAASAACRTIATTLQCPVLALSSLNRAAYATPGAERTPGQLMAGLRETGVLEYDADVVMRLVRAKQPNTLRIDVVKNRQGESGQGTLIVRQPATGRIAEGAMEE